MADAIQDEQQAGICDIGLVPYDNDITSYVNQCPIHLFDTQTNRNISRSELKDNISAALRLWMGLPLTCSKISKIIFKALDRKIPRSDIELRPYVFAVMAKLLPIDDEACFISAIRDKLEPYFQSFFSEHLPSNWDHRVTQALKDLIVRKRAQTSKPSHREVEEQIATLGQYAILSHCWDHDSSQELTFDDVANISDCEVRAKHGFSKLEGFARVVESFYGCRYLWMDTACIGEADRDRSIPLMFGWYRHAYVCVVYLSASTVSWDRWRTVMEDRWCTRGWTLQELLAANRIAFFTSRWDLVAGEFWPYNQYKFHACRDGRFEPTVYSQLLQTIGHTNWMEYEPGIDQALSLFRAMRRRRTTKAEDMVYSLLPTLNIDIPIEYGEGFERALYRLQVEILTQCQDRRLLFWRGGTPSPYNSMLCGNFNSWHSNDVDVYHSYRYSRSFDPTISFSSKGTMRIMVYLHKMCPSSASFALMGQHTRGGGYVGVLLRELPKRVYRRIGYKLYGLDEITLVDKAPEWIYIK
ncbi:hypothetical protein CCMSSC00406_0007072 [Pleurotus cornucopiae]|uniref:Uncharacterized protein n=1 Tax=Pleurotus cornucopiae TaxID=5321 RepID=A0ACB7J5K2_PLECO|nr:hypothetical protein CCMSSC00406_0007072 [Pleurotus cornucopiae]